MLPVNNEPAKAETAPSRHSNVKLALNMRPVLLSFLPCLWLLLNTEHYKLTSSIAFLEDVGLWIVCVPPLVSSFLLFTNTWAGLWASRALAFVQLGWLKVLSTELRQQTDILLSSEMWSLTRLWSPVELTEVVNGLFKSYNLVPNPAEVSSIVQAAGVSVAKARTLATDHVIKLLNPTFWEKSAAFLSSNAFGIITTAVIGLLVGGIYRWWMAPTGLDPFVQENTSAVQKLAEETRTTVLHLNSVSELANETRDITVRNSESLKLVSKAMQDLAQRASITEVDTSENFGHIGMDLHTIRTEVKKHAVILLDKFCSPSAGSRH